jgi:uncharacterized protein
MSERLPALHGAHPGDDDIVDSPCIRVCLYDATLGACSGCLRTLDEIGHWSSYSPDEQRAVLARIARARRAAAAC